jgi:hypothetical protein
MNARDVSNTTGRASGRRVLHAGRLSLSAALLALLLVGCLFGAVSSARAAAAPGKPTAKAPKGTSASATPTFTWSKAKGATKYEVRVYKGSKQLLKKTGVTTLSWTSSKALTKNVALTWKVRASSGKRSGAWSKSLSFKIVVLQIGDAYQGGKVAYILQPTDPGYVAGEVHGLIVAVADQNMAMRWYNGSMIDVRGATGTALGTGAANTTAIIAAQGATSTTYAAGVARAYSGGGYHDWYLPSRDELHKVFLDSAAIGGTWPAGDYWTSSQLDLVGAWYQKIPLGNQNTQVKSDLLGVRAVRSF